MGILKKFSIIGILCLLFVSGCQKNPKNEVLEPISATEFVFNTVSMISVYENKGERDTEEIINEAFDLCVYYDHLLSRMKEGSDIWNINHSDGEAVTVSEETKHLIDKSINYGNLSEGAFDISLGVLSSMWDFTAENPSVPSGEKIKEALSHTGYEKIVISEDGIYLKDSAAQIDLGAIAKGYAADKVKEFLISEGITSGIINLGGNIVVFGGKPEGKGEKLPFDIAISEPAKREDAGVIGYFSLEEGSVVTSGNYERYFEEDGKLYHHILNPETGYPAESGVDSVTIYSESSADGDALSTICFILGTEKGLELIESIDNTEAVFIDSEGEIFYSSGIEKEIPYTKLK